MGLFSRHQSYSPTRDRAEEVIAIQQQVTTIATGLQHELGRMQQILDQIDRQEDTMRQVARHNGDSPPPVKDGQ